MHIFLQLGYGQKKKVSVFFAFVIFFLFSQSCLFAKLGNNTSENRKQFGNEIITETFTEGEKNFSGKKTYQLAYFGWQLEAIYKDGESFSEVARPKGNRVTKQLITENEANVIADVLFPKKDRGPYRKQVKNANFISHFFEYGVVSYEMRLDSRRKNHVGVVGVRTVLYSNGSRFKDIMINAYH